MWKMNYGKTNQTYLKNITQSKIPFCWLWQSPSSTPAEPSLGRPKLVTRKSPWNSIPKPKCWTTRGPKWKFIGAWSRGSNAHRPAWTHARSGVRWITNIVSRMCVLFHFHAGFTGRRDYQSRRRAHSFLNLRSTTFVLVPSVRPPRFRCHRGFGHSEIAIWQFEAIEVAKLYDQWRNCNTFWKKCNFTWESL